MKLRRHNSRRVWELGAACVAAAALLAGLAAATAQGTGGPRYDVATIKPTPPPPFIFVGIQNQPGGMQARGMTIRALVRSAYGGKGFPSDDRVQGGPDWAKTTMYDIDAKLSPEDAAALEKLSQEEKDERRRQMLRALLAERVGLKSHVEMKPMPVYELVVAKGGPKMAESGPEDEIRAPTGKGVKGAILMFTGGKVRAQQYSMKGLADFLSQPMAGVGRPVIDKTGLTGTYKFELTLRLSPPAGMAVKLEAPSEEPPSIFTAVQDELGLKLQPATAALDVIVIDQVNQPTEN